VVCNVTTGASFGNAYLAAKAIGVPADIAEWNPVAELVQPEPHTVYRRHYALFRALYEQTKDIAAALGEPDAL
jgi:xylulokinase